MHITEKTKEYECCCSCKHNKRKKDGENIYCECEIDGHYIGYIECFDSVCERWKKNNMDYETLRNSMTVQDAARVLRDTNCYGTMDIAKNVILKALEQQMSHSEKPNKWIPLIKRPMTVEECGEYVEGRTITKTMLLNCPLPKDGQWVLISYSDGYVHTDIFHNDEGACYFEGFDIDDVEAWMPLPLPYKVESEVK